MASGFGFIDDCYALNVDGTTAWACCDADFPIVRIHDGDIVGWRNDVRSGAALAVDGTTAALVGGSGRLTARQLTAGRFRPTSEYRIVLPTGSPLRGHTQIIGRGPTLHFLTDDYWYQLDIRDTLQQREEDNPGSRTQSRRPCSQALSAGHYGRHAGQLLVPEVHHLPSHRPVPRSATGWTGQRPS